MNKKKTKKIEIKNSMKVKSAEFLLVSVEFRAVISHTTSSNKKSALCG